MDIPQEGEDNQVRPQGDSHPGEEEEGTQPGDIQDGLGEAAHPQGGTQQQEAEEDSPQAGTLPEDNRAEEEGVRLPGGSNPGTAGGQQGRRTWGALGGRLSTRGQMWRRTP